MHCRALFSGQVRFLQHASLVIGPQRQVPLQGQLVEVHASHDKSRNAHGRDAQSKRVPSLLAEKRKGDGLVGPGMHKGTIFRPGGDLYTGDTHPVIG